MPELHREDQFVHHLMEQDIFQFCDLPDYFNTFVNGRTDMSVVKAEAADDVVAGADIVVDGVDDFLRTLPGADDQDISEIEALFADGSENVEHPDPDAGENSQVYQVKHSQQQTADVGNFENEQTQCQRQQSGGHGLEDFP